MNTGFFRGISMKEKTQFCETEIEALKQHYDCRQLAKEKLLKCKEYAQRVRALCPFHSDSEPSFDIYKDRYYCNGCGVHGDQVSFIASLQAGRHIPKPEGKEFVDAINRLGVVNRKPIAPEIKNEHAAVETEVLSIYNASLKNIEDAKTYLSLRKIDTEAVNIGFLKRDINKDILDKFPFLRNDDYIAFPMYDTTKKIVGLNLRNVSSTAPENKHRKIGKTGFFAPVFSADEAVNLNFDASIIVESATDALKHAKPKSTNIIAAFGVNNIDSTAKYSAVMIDSDSAGFKLASSTANDIIISDAADPADSTTQVKLYNFSAEIIEHTIAILLYSNNIHVLDRLVNALQLSHHLSPALATAYQMIVSCSTRNLDVFCNKLFRKLKAQYIAKEDENIEADFSKDMADIQSFLQRLPAIWNTICPKEQGISFVASEVLQEMYYSQPQLHTNRSLQTRTYANTLIDIITDVTPLDVSIKGIDARLKHASVWGIVGKSGGGKTTFACYLAAQFVINKQRNLTSQKVMFFSFEMTKQEIDNMIAPYLDNPDEQLASFHVCNILHRLENIAMYLALCARMGYSMCIIDHAKLLTATEKDKDMLEKLIIDINLVSQKLGIITVILTQPLKGATEGGFFYLNEANTYAGGAIFKKCSIFFALQDYTISRSPSGKKAKYSAVKHITYQKIRYGGANDSVYGARTDFNHLTQRLTLSPLQQPSQLKEDE